jgi:Na+/melibiose symporter-like transporter
VALTRYVKYGLFSSALALLWTSVHTLYLPFRLLSLAPEDLKNTYLGLLTFAGLILAMLVQPLAGAWSDRTSTRWGSRNPFILAGTFLALLFLPGLGFSPTFVLLALSYGLLQVATNIAQGPFQAFIPDLVGEGERGRACGVKSLMEGLVTLAFLRLVAWLIEAGGGGPVPAFLGAMLLLAALVTFRLIKEPRKHRAHTPFPGWPFRIDSKLSPSFAWFILSRLLFYMAWASLQTFAFYILRDMVGVPDPVSQAGNFMLAVGGGVLLAVYPAGLLSDRVGRKPLLFLSGLMGAVGVAGLAQVRGEVGLLAVAGLLGLAVGIFLSTSWALATDLVPPGEEARYLGLANLATAGAAALSRLAGPLIDLLNRYGPALGYLTLISLCGLYFLGGSLVLLKVKAR